MGVLVCGGSVCLGVSTGVFTQVCECASVCGKESENERESWVTFSFNSVQTTFLFSLILKQIKEEEEKKNKINTIRSMPKRSFYKSNNQHGRGAQGRFR